MPSMTLLEMTQDILSDLDSDNVDDISDTVESAQVAQILKTSYFNLIDGKDWPQLKKFIRLEAATSTRPTHMKIPDSTIDIEWVKYNTKKVGDAYDKYVDVAYKTPKDFVDLISVRKSNATDVDIVTDATGVTLNIKNDVAPTFYTSFDDEYLIFDSYDSAIDSTNMQQSKSQCFGKVQPTWSATNTFVADLPHQAFSYLLADAKTACFVILKQSDNPIAAAQSQIQRRRMSQEAFKVSNGIAFGDSGRKGKKY
jgi:hypothetical protein|tara:strand:+ start:977 stop:1738 length:762 start_codon:yes stop_codon:yes gene_type:complete